MKKFLKCGRIAAKINKISSEASTKKRTNMLADEVIAKFAEANDARLENITGLGFADFSICNRTMSAKLEATQNARRTDYNLDNRSILKQSELISFKEQPRIRESSIDVILTKKIIDQQERNFFERWWFYNRSRFKRSLANCLTAFILFALYPLTACGNPDDPSREEGLPFIFPLKDMRWEYVADVMDDNPEHIYDPETGDTLIWILSWYGYDYITYTLRQVGENNAEVYESVFCTREAFFAWDMINQVQVDFDTSWSVEPELKGLIFVEDKKVYYQRKGNEVRSLMYDFNLKLNDTFYVNYHPIPFLLESIDTVLVENEYRERYYFVDKNPPWGPFNPGDFYVVEGLGNVNRSFFHTLNFWYSTIHYIPTLKSIHYKDKLIWGK